VIEALVQHAVGISLILMEAARQRLSVHATARDQWLSAATVLLEQDPRIEAAVLYGSFGRGEADVWSDVDILLFISDAASGDVIDGRLAFPKRFGAVSYQLDSSWNAPVDGAQVNALYVLDSGLPLYVDWNFWPCSRSGLPADTQPLFSRRPSLLTPTRTTFARWSAEIPKQCRPSPGEVDREALRHARFGMVPIAAKYVARRNRDKLVSLLTGIGSEPVPGGAAAELSVVRERLGALSPSETPEAVSAVRALCDVVRDHLGVGAPDDQTESS
jgi:predicted nucleotidyltransferase